MKTRDNYIIFGKYLVHYKLIEYTKFEMNAYLTTKQIYSLLSNKQNNRVTHQNENTTVGTVDDHTEPWSAVHFQLAAFLVLLYFSLLL